MLAIIGTVPDPEIPVVVGWANIESGHVIINGQAFAVNRGTPALLAASIRTCQVLKNSLPWAYLVGDIGRGEGSRRLYRFLSENLATENYDVMAFHYLQPDVDWHNRVLFAVEEMKKKPILIADAGFMYAAKMSGQAEKYDIFTPDVGELAFLADEEAPHPFYTRGLIFHREGEVPELIARACRFKNSSKYLLVKGSHDFITCGKEILAAVDYPSEEAMEAIGGTGDTLTGIAAALIDSGMDIPEALIAAAKINRTAGSYVKPSPATQILDIIQQIPKAVSDIL